MFAYHPEIATYPPWFIILFVSFLDSIFYYLNFPQWRNYVPFGLADKETNGWLSHQVESMLGSNAYRPLLSYPDFLTNNQKEHNLSSMYTYAFETDTTALGSLANYESMIALVGLVLWMRLIKSILLPLFCSIGRKAGTSAHGKEWARKEENEERIIKFGEYLFRLLYHLSVSIYGVWYFRDKPWWDKSQGGTKNLWIGYPNQPIEVGMTWYYLMQSAYNVEALLSLAELSFVCTFQNPFHPLLNSNNNNKFPFQNPVKISWSPTCRGDFREMAIHHIITNLLVIGSSAFRFTRVGSMVFLVHDLSDVPVDLSKLANFMKWKLGTIVFFVTMVLTWAITRLGVLPFVIFRSIVFERHLFAVFAGGYMPDLMWHAYTPIFILLVGGIIALHVFWFFIIVRIGWRLLSKGETVDYSEHKNGEEGKQTVDQQEQQQTKKDS